MEKKRRPVKKGQGSFFIDGENIIKKGFEEIQVLEMECVMELSLINEERQSVTKKEDIDNLLERELRIRKMQSKIRSLWVKIEGRFRSGSPIFDGSVGSVEPIGFGHVTAPTFDGSIGEWSSIYPIGQEKKEKEEQTTVLVNEALNESLKTAKDINTDYSEMTKSIDDLTKWINYKRQEI